MKAIRFAKTGGPEVLSYSKMSHCARPARARCRSKHRHRGQFPRYLSPLPGFIPLPLPSGLGSEAAGVIAALGEGVTDSGPGERVGYGTGPPGSYAEANTLPADKLVRIPDAAATKSPPRRC